VLTYYENPETLKLQLSNFQGFSPALRDSIELVIVDDGSGQWPASPAESSTEGLNVVVARVLEDKPWNHFAARNIGSHEASGIALFLHDMDILVPESTAELAVNLVRAGDVRGKVRTFSRLGYFDGSTRSVHHDTILIDKENFWETGGFDEDFQGIYGAGPLFSKRVRRHFKPETVRTHHVWSLGQDVMPDSATAVYSRKPGFKDRFKLKVLIFAKFLRLMRPVSSLRCEYEVIWHWKNADDRTNHSSR
jgi:hypothetical protein